MAAKLILTAVTAALLGCASHSGVVPAGQGQYIIASQAATGFPGLGNLKADQLREASEFCAKSGQDFELLDSKETRPPYLLGNYPRAEIRFRCVPKK